MERLDRQILPHLKKEVVYLATMLAPKPASMQLLYTLLYQVRGNLLWKTWDRGFEDWTPHTIYIDTYINGSIRRPIRACPILRVCRVCMRTGSCSHPVIGGIWITCWVGLFVVVALVSTVSWPRCHGFDRGHATPRMSAIDKFSTRLLSISVYIYLVCSNYYSTAVGIYMCL